MAMNIQQETSSVQAKLSAARSQQNARLHSQTSAMDHHDSLREAPYYHQDPYAPPVFPQHSSAVPEATYAYAAARKDSNGSMSGGSGYSSSANPFSTASTPPPPAYSSDAGCNRLYQTRTHRSATLRSEGGSPYASPPASVPLPVQTSPQAAPALWRPNAPTLTVPIPQYPSSQTAQYGYHEPPTAEFMSPSDTLVNSARTPDSKYHPFPATPDSVNDKEFWHSFAKKAEEAETEKQSKWLKKQNSGRKTLKALVWTVVILIALGIAAFLVYYFKFRKSGSGDTMPTKHDFGLGPNDSSTTASSSAAAKRSAMPNDGDNFNDILARVVPTSSSAGAKSTPGLSKRVVYEDARTTAMSKSKRHNRKSLL